MARFNFLDPRSIDFYPDWDDAAGTSVALLYTEASGTRGQRTTPAGATLPGSRSGPGHPGRDPARWPARLATLTAWSPSRS